MTKLSDTQAVILSTAAQRDGGAVLPLPETIKIKGGAVDKVLRSLKAQGLIEHRGTPRGDNQPPLCITCAGLEAIGVEPEGEDHVPTDATEAEAAATEDTGTTPVDSVQAVVAPDAATGAVGPANPTKKNKPAKGKARATMAVPAEKRTLRSGTKQALMVNLLMRPEGATIEQIAKATGWQRHTIRGAISGALKKKLGLTVEATRTREIGPNKSGAKGSNTVYRIVG
jgi:hypothetical protein